MSNDFVPAQAIPTWEYIEDELNARGWTREELAIRMGGDSRVNLCTMEFLEHLDDPRVKLGRRFAEGLSRAFGTGAEVWMNIDASYRRALKAGRN